MTAPLRGLLALAAGLLMCACSPGQDGGPSSSPAAPSAAPSPDGPGPGWRTEYWGAIAVDVPEGWGWGGAPTQVLGDDLLCSDAVRAGEGYVGRPVMSSDACLSGVDRTAPATPYVWLGADIDPGTVDLGDGYVRETVEVAGEAVSVATDDGALREQILDSARPSADPCAPPVGAELCLYGDSADGLGLRYATSLTEAEMLRLFAAVRAAPALDRVAGCPDDELFAVARPHQRTFVHPSCGYVDVGSGVRRLTDRVRDALDVQGAGTVSPYLIGPLG